MSSKEVKIRVTGDVSDLLKKLDMVKNSFDKLNTDKISNKGINSLIDDLSDVDKKVEKTVDSMDDLADATGKVGKKNITGIADDLSDTNKKIDNTVKGFEDLNKQINDVDTKPFDAIDKQIASLYENTNDVKDAFSETFDTLDDFTNTKNKIKIDFDDNADPNSFLDDITDNLMQASITGKVVGNSISQSFDNVSDSISQSFNDISDTIKRSISSVDDLKRTLKDIEDYTDKAVNPSAMKDYFDKLHDNALNQMDKATENLDWDAFDEASKKVDAAFENWKKYGKLEKEALGDINKQVDAYKQLREESLAFINDEKNHVTLRQKTAKYLEDARLALNKMGVEVEGIPKDVFDKLNKDVTEFTKNVKDSSRVISFDKIEKDLNRLGKTIEDKTLKIVSNNEAFESVNWKARKATEGFKEASKSIVDFGNNAKYAFEKVEKDGQVIERLVDKTNKLSDAEKKHMQEVNEALAEYQTLMREFGNDISEKFITDGEFDPKKYVKAYEESGVPINQLTMRYKALKQQVLEYLKVEDESIENKAKAIKEINDHAEALRKLGAAADDIDLSDIESFDKSLASNLNNKFKDLFDNDIPGNIKEIKDELKAAFDEFNNLEFGNAFDLLSNAGKGFAKNIFSKIPTQVKVAAAAIAGLTYATYKLYEVGKQQFFEGLANIGNKLQPVINAIQSFCSEVKTAFEEITGMDLSLSGFIEYGTEFEDSITRAGAVAGATGDDFEKLTNKAREMGAKTRYSAAECADALYYMGMAGWDTKDMMSGLEGVLNLATVADMDLAQASDFVTDGLTALGMSAVQATDFVDMLASASTNSNTSVAQMQTAFTNVAPIAGTLGISMSDLSVALGLMANQGVKAEKAGTALKNLLSNMASPTDQMTACIEKYNLQSAQKLITDGKLIEGVKEMKSQLDGLTAKEKTAVITTIAGKEALSGISALLNNSVSDINKLEFAVDSSTKASRAYAQSLGLIDENGKVLIEDFENMTKEQQAAYEQWQNFNSVMDETTDVMTMVGGTTTDLGAIVAKLGEDGEVTADQVNSILDVFDKLQNTSKEATDALKQYGIEIAKNDDGSIDFSETLKNLGTVWDDLSDSEKKALTAQLGVGDSVDELNELYDDHGEKVEELVDAYEKCESVSEHLAKTFDATVKGSFKKLSSAIGETFLQTFDKIKPAVLSVSDTLTNFFDILNGMSEKFKGLKGLGDALKYLEGQSRSWGDAIKTGIVDAVNSLDSFINGGSFDSVLKIGTNIIDGICKGISEAKENGSLDSAINGFITKICDWINQNGPKIQKAGSDIIDSIKTGIETNKDKISSALDTVMGVLTSWAESSSELKTACNTFAGKFVDFAIEGIKLKAGEFAAKVPALIGEWIRGMLTGSFIEDAKELGVKIIEGIFEGMTGCSSDQFESVGNAVGKIIIEAICKALHIDSSFIQNVLRLKDEVEDARKIGKETGTAYNGGVEEGLKTNAPYKDVNEQNFRDTFNQNQQNGLLGGQTYMGAVGEGMDSTKSDIIAKGSEVGTGTSEAIRDSLDSMDTTQLTALKDAIDQVGQQTTTTAETMSGAFTKIQDSARTSFTGFTNIVRNQMVNCANIVRNQAVNMADIFRNQFVNMSNIVRNQAISMANIMRNQMVNCANIVRNQCVNMANIFRNQFVSMANVARNQMVNVSNIIRNQAISWSNVIRNQVQNARNTMTSSFISMRNVARNQMVAISNIIRNQAVTWSNIIRNQAANMRSAMTSAFAGMAASARAGMANVLSVVRSYMAQIRSETSKTMTMNFQVSKTVTTTNVTKNVTKGLRNTMGAISRGSAPLSAPQAMSIGGYATSMSSIGGLAAGGSLSLSIPLYLNGKEIARASATYNEEELAKLAKRNNRKKGI